MRSWRRLRRGSQLIFWKERGHLYGRNTSMFEFSKQLCRAANSSNLLSHLAGPILLWVFFCFLYKVLYRIGGNKPRALLGTLVSMCGAAIYCLGLLCDVTGLGLVAVCLCWYMGVTVATQRPRRKRRRSRSTRIWSEAQKRRVVIGNGCSSSFFVLRTITLWN